ncbi:AbrB family transcriptional regulator [Stutzerimonas azotifigens]|uniref:AbrB family transcriptional regulator n=1 Tax=Stutzerimonas azotifigens TaxID=291995 RepID=UPI00041FFD8D|nr:AbrB family transcriptional regulator [Stutzerimonas azotifigens]
MLIIGGGLAGFALHHLGLPASLLLGPMAVAMCMGIMGTRVRVSPMFFRSGQGVVGLMVAKSVTLGVLLALSKDWHLMLLVTALTILLSAGVGLCLALARIPANAAAWGTAPGAASAMIAMGEEHGADGRLVACMQYMRVVCVVMLGAWIAHLFAATAHHATSATLAPPFTWLGFMITLALALLGACSGSLIPAGALLTPIILGSALQLAGWLDITLNDTLMALAYGAIGSYIGLRFDRATIMRVAGMIPTLVIANIALVLLCACLAWPLSYLFGKDFLSVFLATSPGGLDAMAIIAVETGADASFVVALQTMRLIGIVLAGKLFAQLTMTLAARLSSAARDQ